MKTHNLPKIIPLSKLPGSRRAKSGAHKVGCITPKCKGLLWRADLSRLEEGLGHEGYRCDTCKVFVKTVPDETAPAKTAPAKG